MIDFKIIVYIAGGITTILGAWTVLWGIVRKTVSSISNEIVTRMKNELECNFTKEMKDLDKRMTELIKENKKRDERTRRLTLKNAASRIFEAHSHYTRRGSISTFGLATLEEVYSMYAAEGGNSHAKLCMEQIRKLPIVDSYHEQEVRSTEDAILKTDSETQLK